MNPLLIAGIWLAIAALASLLIGGGARVGGHRPSRPQPLAPRRTSADYRQLTLHDWAAAAHADATKALLGTSPAIARPIPDIHPERDG